jgi:hypothetical protein
VDLSPIEQLSAGARNHLSDLRLISRHPKSSVLRKRHVRFARVLIDPDLDYSQEVPSIPDSLLHDLPLFVREIRGVARSGVAEPATIMLGHTFIVNDRSHSSYPRPPVRRQYGCWLSRRSVDPVTDLQSWANGRIYDFGMA